MSLCHQTTADALINAPHRATCDPPLAAARCPKMAAAPPLPRTASPYASSYDHRYCFTDRLPAPRPGAAAVFTRTDAIKARIETRNSSPDTAFVGLACTQRGSAVNTCHRRTIAPSHTKSSIVYHNAMNKEHLTHGQSENAPKHLTF